MENKQKFTFPPALCYLAEKLQNAGHQAYVVGGAVRDALLERQTLDWDLATSAHPPEVAGLFSKVIPTGLKHGTVTVLTDENVPVEVTTLRLEGPYLDGRHPESVVFTTDLTQDLARRDFTMNAMAYDPISHKFFDPYGGVADMQAKIIRTVGQALDRFNEDGLRPIRAIRFAAQLGFTLDAVVVDAIRASVETTRLVAIERVREELMKILAAPQPSMAFKLFKETGLLEFVLPELLEGAGMEQNEFHAYDVLEHSLRACDAGEGKPLLRLALLLHDIGKPRTRQFLKGAYHFYGHDHVGAKMSEEILSRLRFSNADRNYVVNLVTHHMFYYQDHWTDSAVRRLLRKVGRENMDDLLALRIADEKASGVNAPDYARLEDFRGRIQKIEAEDSALSVKELSVTGNDIMQELNLPPGRQVGEILNALLEKVLDEPSLNQRETLLTLAKNIVSNK